VVYSPAYHPLSRDDRHYPIRDDRHYPIRDDRHYPISHCQLLYQWDMDMSGGGTETARWLDTGMLYGL
jgi:hypothetical protein